jgi:O-antigen/teichoic acid export membrane protein
VTGIVKPRRHHPRLRWREPLAHPGSAGIFGKVVAVGGVRGLTLLVAFACNLLMARLLLQALGTIGFAAVTLILSIGQLFPFADLGVGAAVVNASVRIEGDARAEFAATIWSAVRITSLVSGILIALSALMGVTHRWGVILGPTSGAMTSLDTTVTVFVVLVAAAIPLGIGARILQGQQRIALWTAITGLVTPVTLALTYAIYIWHWSAALYPLCLPAASFFAAVAAMNYAFRKNQLSFRELLNSPRISGLTSRVLRQGTYFCLVSAGLTASYSVDRLIISHVGTSEEVAQYSIVSPVYAAVMSVVSLSGQMLWAEYRKRLDAAEVGQHSFDSHVHVAIGLGVALGILSGVASMLYGWLASGGEIYVPWGLAASLGLLIALQTVQMPSGMVLTDEVGLRQQAVITILSAIMNLALSWRLVPVLGAAGAMTASCLSLGLLTVPWTMVLARRRWIGTQRQPAGIAGSAHG